MKWIPIRGKFMNKMDLSNKAIRLRKKLGEDDSSPIDIFALVQGIKNLTLIFYPLSKNISGVCYKGKDSQAILINSNMSFGRQRFSLAHELFHLFYDDEEIMTASISEIGGGDELEREADQFASYFLIPQYSLDEMMEKSVKKPISFEDVIMLEQYYGVSHQAMLYRLLDEKLISKRDKDSMQRGIIDKAARLGYDTNIYYPSSEEKKIFSLGYYINKADELLKGDIISEGKYEELLLTAFRDDIVYGEASYEYVLD